MREIQMKSCFLHVSILGMEIKMNGLVHPKRFDQFYSAGQSSFKMQRCTSHFFFNFNHDLLLPTYAILIVVVMRSFKVQLQNSSAISIQSWFAYGSACWFLLNINYGRNMLRFQAAKLVFSFDGLPLQH